MDITPLTVMANRSTWIPSWQGSISGDKKIWDLGLPPLIDKITRFDAKEAGVTPNGAARILLQTGPYRNANNANHALLPDFLTAGEARRLIEHVTAFRAQSLAVAPLSWQEVRNRTAVAVQLGGGLSPGDVRGLLVAGVVINGSRVTGLPWKLILAGNGNSPARESPLAAWAGRQLALWLSVREEQGIAGDLVFPSTRTGKPWSKVSSYLAFKSVFEAAGLADPAGGSYKLRHTFALRQLKKGKSAEDVARWLGVQDPAVIERYRRVLIAPVDVV